jgi:hypothetical protein
VITYKSGDLWKVIVLVILIAATFSISFRFILTSGLRPHAPARAPQTTSETSEKSAPGPQLFAQRAQPTSELLGRARSSADPFRPYVTAASAESQPSTAPASPPAPQSGRTLPPLRAAAQAPLRLVGLVTGTYPLAVISGDDTRYFMRVGESLPSGWKLAKLDDSSVVLVKDGDRVTLSLSEERPRT